MHGVNHLRIFAVSTVAFIFTAAGSVHAQSNWQQQQQQQRQMEMQRQQDMQRQQQMQAQEQQRRQMQDEQRRQLQDQQRRQLQDQQRQQMQDQQRRQLQDQQRQQMQSQQQAQQRQQIQNQQKQQIQQQTAEQQRQQMQRQGMLGKDGKPTGVTASGGMPKMARPLTPGEIQRGFTGRTTADGRALIKFQGRIFTVPTSRVSGLSARLARDNAKSETARKSQGVAVSSRVKVLADIGTERSTRYGNSAPPSVASRISFAEQTRKLTKERDNDRPQFYVKSNGEAVPSTGYRYIDSNSPYLKSLISSGKISHSKDGTYFSFNKYDDGAKQKLQVPHDAAIRIEFDTKQVLNDVRIPQGDYGRSDQKEPITRDFPAFGSGGATQAITNMPIEVDRVIDTRTGKVMYERR